MNIKRCAAAWLRVLGAATLIVAASPAMPQDSTAPSVIPDFYTEPGLDPTRSTVNEEFHEHIDPFNGGLQHHYVDMHIPGNGGLDIDITRSYNTASINPLNVYPASTTMGVGWTMHFGRVLKSADSNPCLDMASLYVASQYNPVFELPDGSRQTLIYPDPGTALANTGALAVTAQWWKAQCLPNVGGISMFSPDGTRYDMTQLVTLGTQLHPIYAWYTTKITDKNGNYININYASPNIDEISTITTSDFRTVTFTYLDSGNFISHRLSRIVGPGAQVFNYSYQLVPNTSNLYYLTSVIRPDGLSWSYSYNGAQYNPTTGVGPGAYMMNQATYPQGGAINYGYAFLYLEDTKGNPVTQQNVISSKSVNTNGGGNWTFAYTPGSPSVYDTTVETSPTAVTTYHHIGPNYITQYTGGVWEVGNLVSKQVAGPSGAIQTETYTWGPLKISSQSNFRGGVWPITDVNAYNVPLMLQKQVVKDNATYTTSYSSFDIFGNAQLETEVGPGNGSPNPTNRSTNLTFYTTNTAKWIVKQVQNDLITQGSQTYRLFDLNGNLSSITRDGVQTTHTYNPDGTVNSTTFPRGLVDTYSNYQGNIPQSENQPEGISIGRVVDNSGNVTSYTDGDGHTTTYAYDGLNRVTSINYPAGNPLSIVYGYQSKVATRGGLVETTAYDGFYRPLSVTIGGILRTYTYDPLGRITFASNPGGSTPGTSYQYDALDRVVKVVNADSTFRTVSFGPGTKSLTDERGNTTTYAYRSYGDPSQQFLMAVNAPDPLANITIGRNGFDLVTSVTQGGFTRSYSYNGNDYLVGVTNPETGQTTYGRDAAGNMSSRVVGSSPTTTYTYDGQNRLTDVNYSDGTSPVTQTYTFTNKLATSTTAAANRAYGYDPNDNLVSENIVVPGNTFTTQYGYNGNDQLSTITYPVSGNVVAYAPDVLGRPTQVGSYVTNVGYWSSGQINTITYANGTLTTYNQNNRLWPTSFSTSMGGNGYINSTYTYDGTGNLTAISDNVDPSYNRSMGFDSLNRLTSITGPWGTGGVPSAGTITYSGVGNITSQQLGPSNLSYVYSSTSNLLTSVSGVRSTNYTYDAYGNIITGSGNTYTYDAAPNLKCFNCSDPVNNIAYTYDGLNQRVSITKAGAQTFEIYGAHGNLLAEYTPSQANKLLQYMYLGGKRIAQLYTDTVGASSTTLAVSPPVVYVNEAVTLKATVAGSNPTGTVTFKDGATTLGPGTLAGGVATLQVTFTTTGVHSFTAVYGGDVNNATSTSAAVALTVIPQVVSTISLGASTGSGAVNSPVLLTATVTGSQPSGLVTFYDNGTSLGMANLVGSVATLSVTFTVAGSHSLTASYAGNTVNLPSASSAVVLNVVGQSTTTTRLSATPNPAVVNQTVNLTATVTGNNPTGMVTFKDGATTLGTAPLSAGVATFDATFSTTVGHSLTASYGGDSGNSTSTSPAVAVVVTVQGGVTSATALAANPNPASAGQSVTLTATVAGTNPTGAVLFLDGTTPLGSATVSGGIATYSAVFTVTGNHSLTASYSGDANNAASTSAALIETVNAAAATSTTTLTVSPNPAGVGLPVTLTATVAGSNPTGTVSFTDGATLLGTANVSSGVATLPASFATTGSHTIGASYSGDSANGASSASSVVLTVTAQPPSATTLVLLPNPVLPTFVNGQVVLLATVTGANPTGTVTFTDGGTTLGTAALSPTTNIATLTPSFNNSYSTTATVHNVIANYGGDVNNPASSSSPVIFTVTAGQQVYGQYQTTITAWPNPEVTGIPGGRVAINFSTFLVDEINQPTITLSDGANVLLYQALTGQPAALSTLLVNLDKLSVPLAVGPHHLTATIGTFANPSDVYPAWTSASVDLPVYPANTITASLTVLNQYGILTDIMPWDQGFTIDATMSGGATGTVTFMDGSTILGSVAIDGTGNANLSVGPVFSAGLHSLTASYDENPAVVSPPLALTIYPDIVNTETALAVTPNPVVANQPVVLTATVTGNLLPVCCTVTFYDGTTSLGSVIVDPGTGIATLTTTLTTTGTHAITANYDGYNGINSSAASVFVGINNFVSLNYLTSVSPAVPVIVNAQNPAVTATALAAAPNPAGLNQTVTMTATVTGGQNPTGAVTFKDGGTVLGAVGLAGSVATFTVSFATTGSHSLTATYSGDPNNATSTSSAVAETVNTLANSTTTLSVVPNPAGAGQPVTLNATVTGNTPTGTVTYYDAATVLGTVNVNGGSAPLNTTFSVTGTHSLTASYSGDSGNTASASAAVTLTVTGQSAATTTTLTAPIGAVINQQIMLTIAVNGYNASGTVTVMDGGAAIGTATVSGGAATLFTTLTTIGNHVLTASYGGDTWNGLSTSAAVTVPVAAQTTSLMLVYVSPNPSIIGEPITFTAALFGSSPQGGSVTFTDGNTVLGTANVDAQTGTATLTTAINAGISDGDEVIATWTGDTYNAGTSAGAPSISLLDPNVDVGATLAITPNPTDVATGATATAAVTGYDPSSAFTLYDEYGQPVAQVPLNVDNANVYSGSAVIQFPGAALYNLTGYFSTFSTAPTLSNEIDVEVFTQYLNSNTVLTADVNPALINQSVNFTATVTVAGAPAGNGSVSFFDAGTPLGTSNVTGGIASLATIFTTLGAHAISASYVNSGQDFTDPQGAPDNSQVLMVAVTLPGGGSSTALVVTPNPADLNQPVTLTATVVGNNPTGTVTFNDGATVLGTAPLNAGVASFVATFTTVGTHNLVASYGGDSANTASVAIPIALIVNSLTFTTTTLTAAPSPASPNQAVTLTATVTGASPTGTVTFTDGTTTLGTAPVTAGVATLSTSFSIVGSHNLSASYPGDTNNASSVSATLAFSITGQAATTTTEYVYGIASGQAVTNQPTLLTAAVTGSNPTGTVTFFDGSTNLGMATLTPSGSNPTFTSALANLTVTFTTAGTHVLTASYSGDANNTLSTSIAYNLQVTVQTPTTTILYYAPSQITPNFYILTAGVTGNNPTGTVTYAYQGQTLAAAPLSNDTVGGIGCSPTIPFTAAYSGDRNNLPSTGSITIPCPAITTTALVISPNPAIAAQTVTYTATVNGGNNPGGSVSFYTDNIYASSVSLSGNTATYTTTYPAPGVHNVFAIYLPGNNWPNYATSTSPTISLTVNPQPNATTTTMSAAPNPAVTGQAVTLSATVTGASPTGTVTFKDGATVLGSANLTSGAGSLVAVFTTSGSHSLTATYNGDTNNAVSTSGAYSETVNGQTVSMTTLAAAPNPAIVGQTVTMTATVAGSSPTGTVTFKDGATSLGTAPISAGVAMMTTTFSTSGSHSLTVAYSGDLNNTASISSAYTETVNSQTVTTTALTVAPNPANVNQSVTLTVAVTGANPTGIVTFKDGAATIGTGNLTGGGATLSISFGTAGSHSLTAVYGGDANNTASTSSSVSLTVNGLTASATTLSAAPNPAGTNQPVALTATVTGSNPTGTVTFKDGATVLGTATVSAATATLSATFTVTGSHGLTATYSGDANNTPSTSASYSLTVVSQSATTTTLTATPNPALVSQSVTLTAHVTGTNPTGTVSFLDGATSLGTAPVNAGNATLTTSFAVAGSHNLKAQYGGDANNGLSVSSIVALTVTAQVTSSSTTLTASPNPASINQSVTLRATVTGNHPTGIVAFNDGSTTLGTSPVNAGVAAFVTTFAAGGAHDIAAVYEGDSANNASVSSTVVETIISGPACALSASSTDVAPGASTTLSVTGTNLPNGTTFFWYGTENGQSDANGSPGGAVPGSVTVTNTPAIAGTYTRYAQLRNTQGQSICTTNTVTVVLEAPTPTCSLQATSLNVPQGASTTLSVSGTNLPNGSAFYWYGSDNGTTDAGGQFGGNVPGSVTVTNNPNISGTYTRYAIINNPQGQTICTTNTLTIVLQPPPTPTCALSASSTTVAPGASTTLSITGTNLPTGSAYYWYGTENGVTDATGQFGGAAPGSISITNVPALAGTYTRDAQIRNAVGQTICTTNTVTVVLQAPVVTCSLQASSTDVALGASTTLSVTGTGLPNGATYYYYGTKNGVTDANGQFEGTVPGSITVTDTAGLAGVYTRDAQIRSAGQTICTTNSVTVTLH